LTCHAHGVNKKRAVRLCLSFRLRNASRARGNRLPLRGLRELLLPRVAFNSTVFSMARRLLRIGHWSNDRRKVDAPMYRHRYRTAPSLSAANCVRAMFVAILSVLAYSAARADGLMSLDVVRQAAEQHVVASAMQNAASSLANGTLGMVAQAGELDSRLRLATCDAPPLTFSLNGATIAARNTIGVRCAQGANWTVYIPVLLFSDVEALILTHHLPRGAHITTADVRVEKRRVPGPAADQITQLTSIQDCHLKRAVSAGTVLTADLFARDQAIKRGQQVILMFASQGLAVQANGVALADAAIADRIRVQNLSSLKVVEGIVASGNLVKVH
jgi:flagella basal body P-ring formation protein FlgA